MNRSRRVVVRSVLVLLSIGLYVNAGLLAVRSADVSENFSASTNTAVPFYRTTYSGAHSLIGAFGNTIYVTTTSQGIADDGQCSLQEAIYAANFDFGVAPVSFNPLVTFDTGCNPGSGDDTIVLEAGKEYFMSGPVNDPYNPVGPAANPVILSNMTIDANGARLVRANPARDFVGVNFRAFVVLKRSFADPNDDLGVPGPGTGSLLIRNAHIKGFTAKGGDGRAGGGGGLGAGGAVYVHDARLSIENSTFEDNGAGGGRGSVRNGRPGGGGGGMGGNGGYAQGTISHNLGGSGAGGGGSRGDGADNGFWFEDCFPNACWTDTNGGGGGGTLRNGGGADGYGQGRGYRCGGGGAGFGNDGGGGECPGGGGGGGGEPDVVNVVNPDGDGGNGHYGGGGGGGGSRETSTFFHGGTGGRGGFGGGGGAGGQEEDGGERNDGGDGGFGGGGGAGGDGTGGIYGMYGGDGSEQYGGGGAGLGGAIFNHRGIVSIWNSTFTGNYAVRGTAPTPVVGGTPAESGKDAGGAIFTLNGTLEIYNSTISRNETTGDLGAVVVQSAYDVPLLLPLPPEPSATFKVYNTIIAKNGVTSDGVAYSNSNGECLAGGFNFTKVGSNNLVGDNYNAAAGVCPGVSRTADPQLLPLALNEPGLTPTMALAATSPAINAGVDLASDGILTDQRGVTRPAGAYDIGAYELFINSIPVGVAPDPATVTNEDTQIPIIMGGTDADQDALSFAITDHPDNGSLGAIRTPICTAGACIAAVTYTPALNFNGVDSFKFKVNDGEADSEEVTVSITVIPVNDAPVVSATPLTQANVQYSDPIAPVTITARDTETPAGSLAITTSYTRDGGSPVTNLPEGLSLSDDGVDGSGRRVWTVSGVANVPAGTYVITARVADRGDPDNVGTSPAISTSVSFTLNVIKENVIVTASSALSSVKVASPGGTSPAFHLSAELAEEADGSPGDISKASPITFALSPVGGGSSPTCNNSGSVSGSGLTVACTFSNVPVGVYEVSIVVGGDYYTGGGSSVLTVYDPSLGFVIGGGWIVNPITGHRAQFGVNVKYLKNGKAQGQMMYIEHRPTGDVKIKSNSMQNAAILTNEAQVTAKANYGDVGNYVVIARVIDNGEPGTHDRFGLKLLEPSGRAVADFNFLTNTVLLGGGNNQVPKKK